MPLAEGFVTINVTKTARRRLKELALVREVTMWEIIEELLHRELPCSLIKSASPSSPTSQEKE